MLIKGTSDRDELHGTADSDDIYGYGEEDFLHGGAGNDRIFGGGDDDYVRGEGGDDLLSGGAGNDYLFDELGDDTLLGGDGNDVLLGDAGNDSLVGGAGDDSFRGGSGSNILDGGAGDDVFEIGRGPDGTTNLFSGGAGQDRYNVSAHLASGSGSAVPLVTDFAVGPDERDLLDLDQLLFFSDYSGGNPFTAGYLELAQSGADTLLRWDHDGSGGDDWITLITLQNVTASAITADNIVGGIPPAGGDAPGQTVVGGAAADSLVGGFFDDQISGLDGNDRLEGKIGNDTLNGGTGADFLVGGFGDDSLLGGGGNDSFTSSGSHGNQDFWSGDDYLDGGGGSDEFADIFGHNTLIGGAGADRFHVNAYGTVDDSNIATGGSGRDTYLLSVADGIPLNPISTGYFATDFVPGSGSERDLLDPDGLLVLSALENHYTGGNPFDAEVGFLRFVQSGADTLVQWDRDGAAGGGYDWATQLTLLNVEAGLIEAANLVGAVPPSGTAPGPGQTLDGSVNGDLLAGGYGNDVISGVGGDDHLDGRWGNDSLNGGAGNDDLSGWFGDDTLIGGDGDDVFRGNDQFGNLQLSLGNDHLIGGAGNDDFLDIAGNNIMEGGGGADRFHVISIGEAGNSSIVTGGTGRDIYFMEAGGVPGSSAGTGFAVTDFASGAGGDLLDIDGLLFFSAANGGYTGGDPFALGYVRFLQAGADTLLQWDVDGAAAGGASWSTQLTLLDVTASSIIADNFASKLVVGTGGNDSLVGGLGNDTVQGLAGNDTLDGSLGKDTLEGGTGSDLYFVDHVDDVVVEENNDAPAALLLPGSGSGAGLLDIAGITDTVRAAVTYSLENLQFVENLTLSGTARSATGNALANVLKGNGKANALSGLGGADLLQGNGGNDTLNGGSGNDTLTGGAGKDTLVWDAADRKINGGGGTDTLRVDGSGVVIDLTAIPDARIQNIEIIRLTGSGDNTLTMSASDVLAISSSTDTLKVLGDAGDVANAAGFTLVDGSATLHRYTSGTATLLVDSDVAVNT